MTCLTAGSEYLSQPPRSQDKKTRDIKGQLTSGECEDRDTQQIALSVWGPVGHRKRDAPPQQTLTLPAVTRLLPAEKTLAVEYLLLIGSRCTQILTLH